MSKNTVQTDGAAAHPIASLVADGLFYKHPVLVQGLALAPALIASTSAGNALALILAMFFVSIPTMLFASIVKDRATKWLRVFLDILVACVFYIPANFLVTSIYPQAYFNLGVYMPLIVVSSFVYSHAERQGRLHPVLHTLCYGLANNLGFALLIFLIGTFREWLGNSTFLGMNVWSVERIPAVLLPFSGFIIGGIAAGFIQWRKTRKDGCREEEQSNG